MRALARIVLAERSVEHATCIYGGSRLWGEHMVTRMSSRVDSPSFSGRARRLLGALSLVVLAAAPARADLVVKQQSNGFPGAQSDADLSEQVVEVGDDRLRIRDVDHGWAFYVRLDKKLVQEASASDKQYTERPFSEVDATRAKRAQARLQQWQEFKASFDKLIDEGKKPQAQQLLNGAVGMGLTVDGKNYTTEAHVEEFPEDTGARALIVDGKKKALAVRHLIIREARATKPVFDLWVVDDPALRKRADILKFWREVGPFSDEVRKVLEKDVTGVPVEITASVDDGSMSKTLHAKVLEIRSEDVESANYDIPAGFQKRAAQAAPAAAGVTKVKCEVCGKEVKADEAVRLHLGPEGTHYYCSIEHRIEGIKSLSAKKPDKQPNEDHK
jgi:hypothetical protein